MWPRRPDRPLLRVLVSVCAWSAAVNVPAGESDARGPLTDAGVASAWRILRIVDCARCHGKEYEGLAAPSIVDYVRTQDKERFVRTVLDGDPPRGMPAYRSNPLVSRNIEDIYRYFLGRANDPR